MLRGITLDHILCELLREMKTLDPLTAERLAYYENCRRWVDNHVRTMYDGPKDKKTNNETPTTEPTPSS